MNSLLKIQNARARGSLSFPDAEIFAGDIAFVTGESGAGKSSFLQIVNGSLALDAGEVFYRGLNIEKINPLELRKDILLIRQSVVLFSGSVRDNFATFYNYRKLGCPSEDTMLEFLEMCCLEVDLDKNVHSLSGGERQRVYLAILLSFCPPVCLLDEPSSALDEKTAHKFMENICAFARKGERAVLVVSHDQSLWDFATKRISIKKSTDLS